jgi:ribosomal protein S15P/S13E
MEKAKKLTQEEFEKEVVKLAKEGLTSEKIGQKLRDSGTHPSNFKVKISQILKQNNLYIQPDLKNVEAKLEAIKAHKEKNPQDKRAKREKDRVFSQLRKLKIYHKLI